MINYFSRKDLTILWGLIALWLLLLLAIAVMLVPEGYWYSYYAVDYSQGFIRRGLAGELLRLVPSDDYFTAVKTLRWLPTILLSIGLSVLGYAVASKAGRSKRRTLLAMLIPLLPCGFAYALLTGRTDSFGLAAMILFAVFVNTTDRARKLVMGSAVFGLIIAIFTLMHEGTPFLVGLGVLIALAVLARRHDETVLRISAVLALGPGLATMLIIIFLGNRGVSKELCAHIPQGLLNNPLAGNPTIYQLLSGFRFETDYHEWACRIITPYFDMKMSDAVRLVANIGAANLSASTALGLVILTLTILSVSYISGVPFSRMAAVLRMRASWVVFGLALYVPIFCTGTDWTRWWVMITFNIGTVFLLFASGEPESAEPTDFGPLWVVIIALLVLFAPFSAAPGFGIPFPV